jgi:hypothetical protein
LTELLYPPLLMSVSAEPDVGQRLGRLHGTLAMNPAH